MEGHLCRRYCVVYRSTAAGDAIHASGNRGMFGQGSAHNANNPVTWTELPVEMRTTPSLAISAAADFSLDRGYTSLATYSALSLQGLRSTTKTVGLIGTTSGLNNGDVGILVGAPDEVNAKLTFDAEL